MASSAPPPPRCSLCVTASAFTAISGEYAAAGWRVHGGLDLPEQPWVRQGESIACSTILDGPERIADAAVLLGRGVALVLLVDDIALATTAFDQLRRMSDAEWFDESEPVATEGLDPAQIELLSGIRDGDDIAAVARRAHLSQRTAARRLAAARRTLGVATTAEAAARVGGRIDRLRR